MSTHGCLAVPCGPLRPDGLPEAWIGVFVHWDGYPTVLGAASWQHYQHSPLLHDFAQAVIFAHDGGYGDYPARCYCHDDGSSGPYKQNLYRETDEITDAWHIEWVYLYTPDALLLHVGVPHNGPVSAQDCGWRWQLVARIPRDTATPDWEAYTAYGEHLRQVATEIVNAAP